MKSSTFPQQKSGNTVKNKSVRPHFCITGENLLVRIWLRRV